MTSVTILLWAGVIVVAIMLIWAIIKEVGETKDLRAQRLLMLIYGGAVVVGLIFIFLGRMYFQDNFFAHWLRSIGQ